MLSGYGDMVPEHDSGFSEMLVCNESLSPFSKQTTPVQEVPVVPVASSHDQSALMATGSLTYFSDLRKRKVLYTPKKTLGAGAFGTVYKCVDAETSEAVAIKYIRIHDAVDGIPQWALREIALLRRCSSRHPNIIRLVDMHCRVIDAKRCDIHLILEYCDMDLKQYIKTAARASGSAGLEQRHIKELLYQMLQGLDFLHVIAVAHRDIKPQNVLVKEGVIKIADFGLGKIMFERSPVSLEVVTLHYRPPEVLLNVNYSLAVDIWSVGCIFAEMCDNQILLGGDSEINQLKTIFSLLGTPSPQDWPKNCSVGREFFLGSADRSVGFLDRFVKYIGIRGVDLLKNMLKFNPAHRLSTLSALRHEYFNGHISSVAYTVASTTAPQMSHFGLVEHGQIPGHVALPRHHTLPADSNNDSSPDLYNQMRRL